MQEFLGKRDDLELQGVQAHLIGHLQTNKVKYIIDKVSMIHSVDSLSLASEIEKQAAKHNLTMKVLAKKAMLWLSKLTCVQAAALLRI